MTDFRLAPEALAEAAAALVSVRRGAPRLPHLPDRLRPRSDAEGYAIQAQVTEALGWRIAGWKAGLGPNGDTSSAPLYAPDDRDGTLRSYGEHVIPAVNQREAAKV